ncbi:MAG: ankyrin repeat domain-containing protein [Candidatus Sericytochromatia bacterium]|nr:ankyrin repeat domain-containing protein [Candidatus Sericytochromatia bacterium]
MSSKSFFSLAVAAVVVHAAITPAWAAPARTTQENELIEAAYAGLLPKVQKLLSEGTSVEAQDENGYTALHWAAQSGWPLTSKALLAKGANVNARDYQGRTPLLLATVRGYAGPKAPKFFYEVAKALLAEGADPNMKDNNGLSAAEYARARRMNNVLALFATAKPKASREDAHGHEAPKPEAHGDDHGQPAPKPAAAHGGAHGHAAPKPAAAHGDAHGHAAPKPAAAHGDAHGHAAPKPAAAHGDAHGHAAPKPAAAHGDAHGHAAPKPPAAHGHAAPKPAAPKPAAHGDDHGHSAPKPGAQSALPDTQTLGGGHDMPFEMPAPAKPASIKGGLPSPARPAPIRVAAGDTVTFSSRFKEQLSRLYTAYNDHLAAPESGGERTSDQPLEDKVEQVFNLLAYGSKDSLSRAKLQEARTSLVAAQKMLAASGANSDKIYRQTLDGIAELLSAEAP